MPLVTQLLAVSALGFPRGLACVVVFCVTLCLLSGLGGNGKLDENVV